jgi:hypothetical protein
MGLLRVYGAVLRTGEKKKKGSGTLRRVYLVARCSSNGDAQDNENKDKRLRWMVHKIKWTMILQLCVRARLPVCQAWCDAALCVQLYTS